MPAAVKMLVFAGARDVVGVGELEMPLPAPCSAGELLAEVCRRFPGLAPYGASLRMAVNGRYVDADNPVVAGDEVALIPSGCGGLMSLLVPEVRIPRRSLALAPTSPRSVRVSVTDRCDFACTYCRPSRHEGYADGRLLPGAWQTMFEGLRRAGLTRVRLTGGEPLLHPEIVAIVRHVRELGFKDISLTTNASQLARLAGPLKEAGLVRVNVSIDTLDPERFRSITRGGELAPVLAGIDAAIAAGLAPIKLNTVVLRGVNDDELASLVTWAWERRMVPRFLEVMPIAEGAKLVKEHLVTAKEMKERLSGLLLPEEGTGEAGLGPAKYVRARHDPGLRVGFITGTSDTFCASCDRLRVSSTGVLRPCLATDDGVDAGASAAEGDADAIVKQIEEAWTLKPDGEVWKGCTEETAASVSIRAIGG